MSSLITQYVTYIRELDGYLSGAPVTLTGSDLSLAQIEAISRYVPSSSASPGPSVPPLRLSACDHLHAAHDASRHVIASKVAAGLSIYGVSTGFGGSADMRTDDPIALGAALLQHLHVGVLIPSASRQGSPSLAPLPLSDPTHSTTMSPAWTRAAMLVRTNSLLRGHSGVRWELMQKMVEVIEKGLVPLVPLRGSISASGDLSPLSYVAGMVIGNPAIRVWMLGPPSTPASPTPINNGFAKPTLLSQSPTLSSYTASEAFALSNTTPLPLASKEHLGILNGTAFSAGVAALALNGTKDVAVLGAVLTALSIEALLGSRGSFDPFVSHARPHPGQIESAHLIWSLLSDSKFTQSHEVEVKIEEDQGVLRQDRYSLRTSPQWLGPQFEDIKKVEETIRVEINSTTDNPLVEPPREIGGEGKIHHAGNFQALAVTNAMDHLRLSLAHIGRLMFVQLTEMINCFMNRGLPANLSGGESALDFGCKGIDTAAASYTGELNTLGGMNVGVANVSAEMHNQSVNSLALISARYTLTALEVSQLLAATHLFAVCQALDLRALCIEMKQLSALVVRELVRQEFSFADELVEKIAWKVLPQMYEAIDRPSSLDTVPRMAKVANEVVAPLLEALASLDHSALDLSKVAAFRRKLANRLAALLTELRCAYLDVPLEEVRRGCMESTSALAMLAPVFNLAPRGRTPASAFLAPRTRVVYEFVREDLGIGMHGADNLRGTVYGMRDGVSTRVKSEEMTALGETVETATLGHKITTIVEAIRDGRMARVLARACEGVDV